MALELIDFLIIISFFLVSLFVGIAVSKKSSKNASSFYLSGRNMRGGF
ncbi:sodium-solute symporter [Nonlabens ulvanivorans]|uniref:Sodium-solute symporter n=1 Tax=Nonlabens ulvanivorans TaxID=906888 RepID=A0A081DBF6_NONUL|nr:hypothetical protein [Nonlabens ulvanivorans]GAK76252.1 sodium-solute symporter [Nonlabens ulvanivorans]GAL01235.1 putative sodium-solute symporter [Nonlabens ulvanivorans]GAL76523.1 sodium-solute symporter [Nonlabens ulvanivorans]